MNTEVSLKEYIDNWNSQEKERNNAYTDAVFIYPSIYEGQIFKLDFRFNSKIYGLGILDSEWKEFIFKVDLNSWGGAYISTDKEAFRHGVLTLEIIPCEVCYTQRRMVQFLEFLRESIFCRQD